MFDTIQKFIARNLLAKTQFKEIIDAVEKTKKEPTAMAVGERVEEQAMAVNDNQTQEKETSIELAAKKNNELTEQEFVKAEKSLIEFGFFSPVKSKKESQSKKVIPVNRIENGNKVEATATILPSAEYGRPTIADQDKYLALQKLIVEKYKKHGEVKNPIVFSSSELLSILGKTDSGKNFKDVVQWLDRMYATTIFSEGAVYLAGKKTWARDRLRVFERAISAGQELEPGKVTDKNAVWLSDWQLENINNNYLLPVDIDSYKHLKQDIAKALAPLLQIWLYASRNEKKFEKLYSDICKHLGITCYTKLSDIQRRFCPSLDELKKEGYLAKWELVQTADKKAYKIIFYHGSKFYQDRVKQLERKQKTLEPPKPKKQTQPPIDITPEPQPAATPQPKEAGESKQTPQSTTQPQPETPQISRLNDTQQHDLPPTHTELSPEAQNALYELINAFGVGESKALELITTKPEETQDQLAAFKYRYPKEVNQPANKAGLIIKAIENSYQLPDAYLADKKQQEEKRRNEEQQKIREACNICNGKSFVRYTELETKQSGLKPCKHSEEFRQEIFAINQAGKVQVTTIDYKIINK